MGRGRSDMHMGRRGRQAAKQEGRRPPACTFMAMCLLWVGQSLEGGAMIKGREGGVRQAHWPLG